MKKIYFILIVLIYYMPCFSQSGFYLNKPSYKDFYFEKIKDKYYDNYSSYEISLGYSGIYHLQKEIFNPPYLIAPWPGWDNQFQYFFKYRYVKKFPFYFDIDYQKLYFFEDFVNPYSYLITAKYSRVYTSLWNANFFTGVNIYPNLRFIHIYFGIGLSYYRYVLSEKKNRIYHLLDNHESILISRNCLIPAYKLGYTINMGKRFFIPIEIQQSITPVKMPNGKQIAYKHFTFGMGLRF